MKGVCGPFCSLSPQAGIGTGELLPSTADFIDVPEQIRRILVDTIRAAALQFVTPVSSGKEPDAERARAAGGQHIPDAVADHTSGRNVHFQTSRLCKTRPAVSMRPLVAIAHGTPVRVR